MPAHHQRRSPAHSPSSYVIAKDFSAIPRCLNALCEARLKRFRLYKLSPRSFLEQQKSDEGMQRASGLATSQDLSLKQTHTHIAEVDTVEVDEVDGTLTLNVLVTSQGETNETSPLVT